MGFIADIFEFIANTIRKIIEGIANALKWVMNQIKNFMDGIGKWIVMAVIAAFIVAPAAMAAIIAGIAGVVKTIGIGVWNIGKWTVHTVIKTVKWLGTTFQSFLQAIHFKELLSIHKMAMILSKDYREMMLKVYKEISEFSYEVFGTTEMLHLLLQGSRQMIYSMSSAVGYPVDIAEIEWLTSLDETLQKISERAGDYADNPELIFDDIAEWVYSPLGEKYSTINSGFVLALEGAIKGIDGVAQKVFTINEQTQQVVRYLPSPLRGRVQDILEPLDNRITTFQYDIYEPKMEALDGALSQTNERTRENKEELSGLTRRLVNPVDYLQELDKLDLEDRDLDKRRLDVTINEPFDSDRKELSEGIDREVEIEIEEKEIIPEPSTAPPEFMEIEEKPVSPLIVRKRTNWSVGDY